jgi:hypothetical protein
MLRTNMEPPQEHRARIVTEMKSSDLTFQGMLLEAIDEGLSSLGDSSKLAIYFHLEKTFDIKKHDIPHRIDEFISTIEAIFGQGAKLLQIQIMKNLHKKLGNTFEYVSEIEDLAFREYLKAFEDLKV